MASDYRKQRLQSPKYRVWRVFVDESSTHPSVGS